MKTLLPNAAQLVLPEKIHSDVMGVETPFLNNSKKNCVIRILLIISTSFLFSSTVLADYTISNGTTVDASTITGQTGTLYIYGTLQVSSNVTLSGITSVVIYGPNGTINWTNNSDLSFPAGTTFDLDTTAPGLQPTGGNASKRLIIGSVTIAVSNSNSNNAAFSFEQFNGLGGLPQFTLSSNEPICLGTALNLTATPSKTSNFQFYYNWSSVPAGTFSPASASTSGATSTTITPASSGTYTITCTINDGNGDLITSKSINVTVNSLPTITRTTSAATAAQTPCINTAISSILYSTGGSATGATVSGLPAGVTGTFNAGVFTISGTPTVPGVFNYTVSTTGPCTAATSTGSITVNIQTISLTSAVATTTQTPCINSGITSITYAIGGTATGASVTGLPAGVNGVYNAGVFTISGTPSVSGTFNYTVTTSGTCTAASANGSITVSAKQTLTNASQSSAVCAGFGASINLTGLIANSTNNTINFTINGTAQTPVSGVNADASGNASFTTSALSITNNGQTLQITGITSGSCTSSFSKNVTLSVNASGTWLGINTNWNDAQNWCSGVPTTSTDAILPAGLTNYPLLNSGTGTVRNISIANGASVIVTSTLKIYGSITNSGTFNAEAGSIQMNGSGTAQNLSGSWFTKRQIKSLIVSNPAGVNVSSTVNDTLNITDHIAFGNVNGSVFNTGDNIALKSSASATAMVQDITNGGVNNSNSITGKVIVERYLPMQNSSISRRWRLLTSPVQTTGAPTINAAWQEGASNVNVATPINPRPGYGTQITNGNTAAAVTKGFDIGTTASPSIYYMNPGVLPNWVVPANTNATAITDKEGFMIFVRGDRSTVISNQFVAASPTTLAVKGKLYTGNVSKTLVTGMQVLGNPYASAISFDNISFNGHTPNDSSYTFYTWDPKTSGSYNVGKFVAVSNDGVGSPSSYTVTPNTSGIIDGTIESGTAFVVVSPSGAPNTFTFHESDKIKTSSVTGIASRPAGISELSKLYTNLYAIASDGTMTVSDGVVNTYYPAYHNAVDDQDALKLSSFNTKENLSIIRDQIALSIEKRLPVTATDTSYLEIKNMDNRNYRFGFIVKNFTAGFDAQLEDSYTGGAYPIRLDGKDTIFYDFSVNNSIPASASSTRFKIVFKPSAVLPVKFKKVNAYQHDKKVVVEWKVENEINIQKYVVEKSTDGINFTSMATVAATGNSTSAPDYSSLDETPLNGANYYRIISVDNNGANAYSQIVKVMIGSQSVSVKVYPTVIINNSFDLQFINTPKGEYVMQLLNAVGQMIFTKQINHPGGSAAIPVTIDKTIAKGVYHLKVTNPDKTINTIQIVN